MKTGYGAGVAVAILLSLAVFLLGLVGYSGLLALLLLLTGGWTLVAAFAVVEAGGRTFYAAWGIILAILSSSYFVPLRYALALVLLAIVGLIIFTAYSGKRAPPPAAAVKAG